MGDNDTGPALLQGFERGLNIPLGGRIQSRGGFIQDQDGGIFEQRTGNRQSLTLPAGQAHPMLADQGLEALGQGANEFHDVRRLSSPQYLPVTEFTHGPISDVIAHGIVEQHYLLGDERDIAPQ
jgi:hypothetical protein